MDGVKAVVSFNSVEEFWGLVFLLFFLFLFLFLYFRKPFSEC